MKVMVLFCLDETIVKKDVDKNKVNEMNTPSCSSLSCKVEDNQSNKNAF